MKTTKYFCLLLTVMLLPWLFIQAQLSLNGNTSWLLVSAERLLAGLSMEQGYFEVNPPLSVLYHLPPVILARILPVPEYYLVFAYFVFMIGLSGIAIYKILSHFPSITKAQNHIFIAAYMAANTILLSITLGEREQIVLLGLMPLFLAQLALTFGYQLPKKWLWPVMIFGALAVLIKPHFGLLPTLLLLHRMIVQRKFWVIKDADFIALSVCTLSYLALVFIFFRGFIDVVLPDVLALYVSNTDYDIAMPLLLTHGFLISVLLIVELVIGRPAEQKPNLTIALYFAALICLVPFAVQMKGFYYHLIPALVFLYCAIAMSVYGNLIARIKRDKWQGVIATAFIIVLIGAAYIVRPPMTRFPSHEDYKTLPLSQTIKSCERPCPYFIFHSSTEVLYSTVFYNSEEHASRFPTLWFLPKLVMDAQKLEKGEAADLTAADITHYRKHFAHMVAEDFAIYKPKLLLIGRFDILDDGNIFDFADFFSIDEDFKQQWAHYTKDDVLEINRKDYFTGTALEKDYMIQYDVYHRKDD